MTLTHLPLQTASQLLKFSFLSKLCSLLLLVGFLGVDGVKGQTTPITRTTAADYTIVVPAGVSRMSVELTGAGGGGGATGSVAWSRGSGGAGGTYIKHLLTVSSGTYNYTVGAGGASANAGSNSFFGNTGAGTQTGSTVVANGGAAGITNTVAGTGNTAWGTAAANTAVTTGSLPASGYVVLNAGTSGSAGTGTGGTSGSFSGVGGAGAGYASSSAGGAGANAVSYSTNGSVGTAPGGGGSGGCNGNSNTNRAGGAGGVGRAVITYYVVPTVGSLSVSSGPSGTSVTVTGTNFFNTLSKITVDGTEVTTTYLTSTTISANITGSAGAHSIGVNNSDVTATGFGISSSTSTLTFTIATFTNYYSKSTGNLEILSNWGTATDGTGTAPTDFTSANQVFNIKNNATPTIGAAWTVSGTNSKIIVGDGTNGCNFTIPALYSVTGTVDVAAAATLTLQHLTVFPTFGTLNATSTIVFDGNGTQTIPSGTYPNLTVQNSGGIKTLGGNIVLGNSNTLTVAASTILDAAAYTITYGTSGTATINGTIRTANVNGFSGATTTTIVSTNTPTITLGTSSTIVYNAALAQAVTARTYANLQISNTGAAKTPGGNITLGNSNTFTLDAGVTYTAGTTTISFGTSGTAAINGIFQTAITTASSFSGATTTGSISNANSPTITLGTGSTIEYNSTSTQTITTTNSAGGGSGSLVYYNLLISGTTGAKTLGTSPSIAAGGTFTVNASCVADMASTQMSFGAGCSVVINGQLNTQKAAGGLSGLSTSVFSSSNSPSITLGSASTINYNGAGAQVISAIQYANLTIGGTRTSTPVITLPSGTIQITGVATNAISGAVTWSNASNTVDYNGTGNQTVGAFNYNNLTISGTRTTATITLASSGTIDIANTFSITATGISTITVTGSTVNFSSASSQTIPAFTYNTITNTGNGIRTLANGTILIAGTFTPGLGNYTIGTSTVEFNGSTAQTIPVVPVASGGNYYNLTYSGTGTTTSAAVIGGSITVANNFTVANTGTVGFTGANAYTLTINGNLVLTNGTFEWALNSAVATSNISLKGNIIQAAGVTYTTTTNAINGTINFSGSGTVLTPQAISLTSNSTFQYTNLNVNSATVVQVNNSFILSGSTTAAYIGTLTVNGTLNLQGNTVTSSAASAAFTINALGTLITSISGGIEAAIPSSNMTRTFTAGANYTFNGTTTTAFPTTAQQASFGNPANITTAANISLNRPVTMSGTLTLGGILTTTATNTLTLTNPLNTAISGGSTSAFINGPVTWTLGTTSTGTYTVPVGVTTAYYPMAFVAGTIASGSPTINVQAFPTGVSTADGTTLSGTSGNEYWKIITTGSTFAASSFSLGRSTPALGTLNAIGKSTTNATLSYSFIGGTAGTLSGQPGINTSASGLSGASTLYLSLAQIASPSITTTVTANTITDVAASSGGQTITTGASLSAKGVVWNTSTAPTVALSTKTNDGTSTANFTSSLSSLSPETQYFVRAYATNAAGTGYAPEVTFRTLSNPATAQASSFAGNATSTTDIDLTWSAATFPSSGATATGYVLLRATSPNTPSLASANGAEPSAVGNTTLVATLAGSSVNYTNSSLTHTTTYNYLLVPFTWDGTNATTYNYLTSAAPTVTVATQTPALPTITTTGTLSAVSTTYGTASATPTSFTVRGASLTNDIVITPPSGYEVSTVSGSGYSGTSITLQQSSGVVNTTTIYVRLAATTAFGSYSGNITLTSDDVSNPASTTVATVSSNVTAKGLTITGLTGDNKVYDGATTATASGTATYSGLVNGESFSVTGTPIYNFSTASIGTGKTITVTGFTPPNSNYSVTQPSLTANITAKALTISGASASNKTYDRTTTATITSGSLVGIISPDVVTLNQSGTFTQTGVGTAISVTSTSTLGGAGAGNYTLTQPTGLTADITAKALTVSGATVTSKTYTGTNSATITGASLVGVISPDVVTVSGNGVFVSTSVGTGISVTPSLVLGGANAGNYTLTQPTLTGNITTAPLTITGLTGVGRVYNATTTAAVSGTGTAAYSGLVNGESFSVTGTPSFVFVSKAIGTRAITALGYTNPSGNYTVSQPTGLSATITAATLTVNSATATTRAYDATTNVTVSGSLSGVLLSDVVTLSTTGTITTAAVGTGKAVTFSISGADAGNYTLTQPSTTVDITKASQTITFGALTPKTTADAPFALTASTTSGLTISYASSNSAVASVSGSTVTIVGAGTTDITASQAGDGNYNAASNATQTLTVTVANTSTTLYQGSSSAWLNSVSTNWSNGLPSSTNVAQFGTASNSTVGINMNGISLANRTVAAIELVSGASVRTINNNSGTSSNLILTGGIVNSISNVILRNNSSSLMTITDGGSATLGIALANSTDNIINIDGTGGITVSCIISGGNPLTKAGSGSGVLTLSTGNTYTGKTFLTAGTVSVSGESAFGANPSPSFVADQITFNGGTLSASGNMNFSSNRGITFTGSSNIINTNANTVTFTNACAGTGGFTKTGAGTLVLASALNTYIGTTTISAGTINVTGITGITSTSFGASTQTITFTSTTPANGTYQLFNGSVSVSAQSLTSNAVGKTVSFNYTTGVLTVAVAPTVTTPTVASIGTTTATLGATVTDNGGATLTTRGTVWGTAANPTGNILAEGGTAVSAFTHARTGFTANTLYTYRGYAINIAGTGYSADANFTTLSLAPTIGTGSGATSSSFTANWSAPATQGSATYTYTIEVDDDITFATPNFTASSISSGTTTTNVNTGLSANTTYYYRVRAVNAGGNSAWSSTSVGYATLANLIVTASNTGFAQLTGTSITRNTNNVPVSRFVMTVENVTATLSAVAITTPNNNITNNYGGNDGSGGYSSDIDNFKLYYGTTSDFASATLLSTQNSVSSRPTTGETVTFGSLAQSLPANTYYFWITTDVLINATSGRTMTIGTPVITLASGSVTNSVAEANGTFTSGGTISYYLRNNTAGTLGNWNSQPDGSGIALTSFSAADINLIVDNETDATLGGDITLGSGSKIIVSQGITAKLTISGVGVYGTIDVGAAGTLVITSSTIPTLGTLATGSTVTYDLAGDQTSTSAASYGNVTLGGSGVKTLANAVTLTGALTIPSGVTLDASNTVLSGGGSINVQSGATLIVGNASGLNGFNTTSGSSTYSTGANYTFSGTSGQIFGAALPSTVNNLTISNGNTALALNGSQTVNGALALSGGTKLAIGSNTLTLNGTVSGMSASNSLVGSTTSNLTIGGSGALGTLFFDQTSNTTKTLNNVVINRTSTGTVSLGNSLRLVGALTPTAGVLTTGGNLRLLSSAIGTSAAIGIGSSSGGYISGPVDVERYSQAQRGYRTLAHPYTTAQTVAQLTDNFQITGLASGALGAYGVRTGAPSALYYDGTKPVGTTSVLGRITRSDTAAWGVGKGLYVFIRGNGNEGTGGVYTNSTINPLTLDVTSGSINQGDVTVTLSPYTVGGDNYTLVGNPYPCPINLSGVTGIGSFGNVYVYNPTYSGGLSGDKFILRGGFEQQPGKDIIIPSMGCFYIQSTASTLAAGINSITFHESDKVASGTSIYNVFGTGAKEPKIGLEISTSAGFMDRTSIAFDDNAASTATDFYDGGKLGNNLVTFYSLSSERKALGIDYRKTNTADIIPLGIQTATATNYTISLSELTDLPNTQVVLKDKLLKTETILSQVGDSYSFAITADTATKGENRFEIGLLGTTVLPVQIADITAQLQTNKTVAVNWTSTTEVNLANYKVQRSKDGSNFTTVGTVAAKGASAYSYSDDLSTAGILPATIYYRLEAVDKDGSKTYSKVVAVALGSSVAKAAINIYPNPVQSTLFAQVTVTKAGAAQLRVVDAQGKIVATQKTQLAVGTTSISIPAAQLSAGSYTLEIETMDGSKQTQRFVKE